MATKQVFMADTFTPTFMYSIEKKYWTLSYLNYSISLNFVAVIDDVLAVHFLPGHNVIHKYCT